MKKKNNCAICLQRAMPRKCGIHSKTFTLVEAVIVSSLFAVAGLVLVGSLTNGIKIWEKVYGRDTQTEVNLFLETASQRIRNFFLYTPVPWQGDQTTLVIPAYIPQETAAGIAYRVPGEVSYSWDSNTSRVIEKIRSMHQIYGQTPPDEKIVLKNIRSFEFRYYIYNKKEKKYAWVDNVDNKSDIPLAISMLFSVGNENKHEQFRATVWIPLGLYRFDNQ